MAYLSLNQTVPKSSRVAIASVTKHWVLQNKKGGGDYSLKVPFRVCNYTCSISWCIYADRWDRMLFEHLHSMFMKEEIRSPPTTIVQVHKALYFLKTFFVRAVIIIEFGTDPRGDFYYDNFLLLANSEITVPWLIHKLYGKHNTCGFGPMLTLSRNIESECHITHVTCKRNFSI